MRRAGIGRQHSQGAGANDIDALALFINVDLAESVLYGERGLVGRATQALLVAPH